MESFLRIARSSTLRDFGDHAARARREREHDRAGNANATSSVNALLVGERPDARHLAELGSRQSYAFAIDVLKREASITEDVFRSALDCTTDRLAAFRAARIFDAIPRDEEARPFTLADLRQMESEEAACALASIGVIDWPMASRRVRALFMLCALIGSRRS